MLDEAGGVMKIFPFIINHFANNLELGLFRTMTLEQLIFVGGYILLAYPLYLLNEKVIGAGVEFLLFSPREFKDE